MNFITKTAKMFYCLTLPALIGLSGARPIIAEEPPSELYIRTIPDGAKITLDGKELGTSPDLFPVKPGEYKIVIDLEGYQPEEQQINVREGRITRIELKLKKRAASEAEKKQSILKRLAGSQPPKPAGPPMRIREIGPSDAPIAGTAKWEDSELVVRSEEASSVRLFEVPIANRDQCIITYRFHIKTEELKAGVYPEMWCRIPGMGEAFSRGLEQKLRGSNNWTSLEIPFFLKKGELPDLLKLNLVFEGPGTVRLKDIMVLATPLLEKTLFAYPSEDSPSKENQSGEPGRAARKVVEGVGWGAFRVGATREELVKAFGPPDPNPDPRNQWVRWISKHHVDCLIDDQRGAFEVRFNKGFELPLTSGVKIGSSEKEVLLAYGAPDRVVNQAQSKMLEYDNRGVLCWVIDGKVFDFTVFKPSEKGAQERQRYFVRLVIDEEEMTFEGQKTNWEELPGLLEKVPNRGQTVLEIAVTTDQLTVKRMEDVVAQASKLVKRFGFEYLSRVGVHPLGSKGSPPETLSPGITRP